MAVIKVLGKGDSEVDRLHATRTAVEGGILPGGGITLLKASLPLATNSPGGTPPLQMSRPTFDFDQDRQRLHPSASLTRAARTILRTAGEESVTVRYGPE